MASDPFSSPALTGSTYTDGSVSIMLKDVKATASGRQLVGTAAVYVVVLDGDADGSGSVVDPNDYTYVNGYFLQSVSQTNCRCDMDLDGTIGNGDMLMVQTNLNTSATCTLPPAPLGLAYTWDAENRLTQVVTRRDPANVFYLGDTKVEFRYDYMGRRVRKAVYTYNGSWPTTPTEAQVFIYDGWNPVLVLNGLNNTSVKIKYTWGLDLSGSVQGAGGIGGLLAAQDLRSGTKNYWFLYDANGNVGQVLDATNLSAITTAAKYEYDPYGNTLTATGTYAAANPFRFSTKWFDTETGLSYYGYRYYSERLGRWMSRDPIGERGGLNLVAFVRNAPASLVDPIGLFDDAKNEAVALFTRYRNQHAAMTYYRPSGLSGAFDMLRAALFGAGDVKYLPFGPYEALYNPATDNIFIRKGTTDGLSIVHELVHSLDDNNDWYIRPSGTDERQSDALAYAVEQMVHRALLNLGPLDTKSVTNCRQAQKFWRGGWSNINAIVGYQFEYGGFVGYGRKQGRLWMRDVWDVNAKLGFRLSCSQLRPLYEEVLAKRGITDTPASAPSSASSGPCPCKLTCDFGPDLSNDPGDHSPCPLWPPFQ